MVAKLLFVALYMIGGTMLLLWIFQRATQKTEKIEAKNPDPKDTESTRLRPFSKPPGFDERMRQLAEEAGAAPSAHDQDGHAEDLELLEQARRRIRESPYPRPDCLQPYEVEMRQRNGTLSEEREAHLRQCSGCRCLVGMPDPANRKTGIDIK